MATNAVIQTVGAAGYVSLRVTQASHGLTGRVPVYYNTSTNLWTAARANAGTTLGTHLAKVIDSNTLLIVQSGIFPDSTHGLTAGQYYFVSDSAAGTLTVTEPTAVGSFSNPMIYVTDANTYIVLGYRSSQTVNQSFNPLLNDGTAAAPSLAFSADTDTGLYRIGNNTIGIATNGTRVGEIGAGYGGFTGNVIQVVNSTNSYSHTITYSLTAQDILSAAATPWEVSITPKYSNSKIILLYVASAIHDGPIGSISVYGGIDINRKIASGAYSILYESPRDSSGRYQFGISGGASSMQLVSQAYNQYVDTPSTTSQVTYKLTFGTYGGGASTARFNHAGTNGGQLISYMILAEVQV